MPSHVRTLRGHRPGLSAWAGAGALIPRSQRAVKGWQSAMCGADTTNDLTGLGGPWRMAYALALSAHFAGLGGPKTGLAGALRVARDAGQAGAGLAMPVFTG